MLDLVARGDILDALIEKGQKSKHYKWGESWELNLTEIKEAIESVSHAETKRMKGKWVRRKDKDCWECSECHAVLENSDIGNHNFYYCYHCGADMMDICGYMNVELELR